MTDSSTATSTAKRTSRPSIYDVANAAGVSHMTVSRVMNGHPNIKESTRERVMLAIKELNYTRSSIARALATNKAMRIGVLVDAPVQYGPNSTLRSIERAAREVGYNVSSYSTADAGAGIDKGAADLLRQGIDGLCVVAPRASSLDLLGKRSIDIPMMVIKADSDEDVLTAAVDQDLGAQLAVQHLIDQGHQRILHLAGPLDWLDARARERSWRATVTAAGLEVIPAIVGDWSSDFGYEVGLNAPEIDDVTAVFTSNDQIALGLIHGLRQRGLSVPDDISVVGFDDFPDAKHFLPPLTTVRQDFEALGRLAIAKLVTEIDSDEVVESEHIAPQLLVRESTRRI